MKSLFLVLLIGWSFTVSRAQLVNNNSIEGAPRPNRPPSFWYPCSSESTPDTQPGSYGVQTLAVDGRTYLSLVTRKLDFDPFEVQEDVETRLNLSLIPGIPYLLQLSLSRSASMGYEENGQVVMVNQPVRLQVFGGSASCLREELLWETPEIDSEEWQTFAVEFTPLADRLRYIILVAAPVGNKLTDGNVLIDNVQLREVPVQIPSAFTPNGDGVNDLFEIGGLRNNSKLEILTRDGKKVYENLNYDNSWDGGELPAGVYFYKLTTTIRPQVWKGEISLLR